MSLNKETSVLVKDLLNFMRDKFGFENDPKIHFIADAENAKNVLAKTGHYDPDSEEIVVYIKDRHPKDILRSVAHELLHHIQKYEGEMEHHDMSATADPNYIMHDNYLKMIEADAFERGNIAFREWEALKKGGTPMSESKKIEEKKKKKKISKAKLKVAHKHAKSALKHGGFEQYGDRAKEVAYATMTKMALRESKEPKMSDKKEVEVNETLKNSHNYSTTTRAMPETAAVRDEFVYEELLKKFKIKK